MMSAGRHPVRRLLALACFLTTLASIPESPVKAATLVYTYEVRGAGNATSLEAFASLAAETLSASGGWNLGGSLAFSRVPSGGHFTLWLAAATQVPTFGPPCDSTYSCSIGRNVIINETRWLGASPSWNGVGASLRDYRHMVMNHEVGHWLGFGHSSCGGNGQLAPVMQQQSISLQGCRPNPWPLEGERRTLSAWKHVPILTPAPTPPPPPGALPSGGPVGVNHDGRFETFGITAGGMLMNAFQHAVGAGWSGWYPHGGTWPTGRQPSIVRNAGGFLEAFAVLSDGRLVHSAQLAPGLGWSTQDAIGAYLVTPPSAARNRDGRLEVFAVGLDANLWHNRKASSGAWSGWQSIAGPFGFQPAVGTTADGRLMVVGVALDGQLRGAVQSAPDGQFGAAITIGSGVTGRPAIARDATGAMQVAALGTDGRLWHTRQVGFGWQALEPFSDATFEEAPAFGTNADGRLELFAVDTDGRLVHKWQIGATTEWSAAFALGSGLAMAPTVAANADGRLEAFALGADAALWHTFQVTPNGPWSPLYSLGGALSAA